MPKIVIFLILVFSLHLAHSIVGQENIYNINLKKEVTILGLGMALNTAGYLLYQNADRATAEGINLLNPDNLMGIDRGAIDNYSQTAKRASDVMLFSSASLPLIAYSFKKCRREEWSIVLMGIETFLLTNGVTFMTKSLSKRYRPFNYNPNVEIETKLGNDSRLSFFSGHVSQTAAMSFFLAQVITDLNPEINRKYLIWTTAAILPMTIGYLRYSAGKHFPTDVLAGYAVGATLGFFIPKIHLNKNIMLAPTGSGISLVFTL